MKQLQSHRSVYSSIIRIKITVQTVKNSTNNTLKIKQLSHRLFPEI